MVERGDNIKRIQFSTLPEGLLTRPTVEPERRITLHPFAPSPEDRLFAVNSFSKTWAMTGWRLGWSVWPAGLYDKGLLQD